MGRSNAAPVRFGDYSSRSATATGRQAARMAGGRPPKRPISRAKIIPARSRPGVILKANAKCEKVCQFIAPVVRPFKGRTATAPMAPPIKEIRSASIKNENTTAAPPNPKARMVAISRPRSATAEYMVLSAPKTAPMAITAKKKKKKKTKKKKKKKQKHTQTQTPTTH